MAAKYTDVITTKAGTVLPGATVQLLDGSGALVTTYTNDALTAGGATEQVADDNGLVELYVADGTYTVRQSYAGVTTDLPNVELYDISTIATTSDGAVANKAQASAIGIGGSDADMGTFTGSTISDNGTAKAGMQELETELEAKNTAIGIALGASNLGTFTGSTISDNGTVKAGMQELETAHEAAQLFDQTASYTAGTTRKRLQRFICINDAPYNASPAETAANNSAAYNDAIAYLAAAGGGEIYTRTPGTYLLANTNSGAASWDNYRCIYINTDNVTLRFANGVVLKLDAAEDAHVIKIGSRTTSVLTVSNIRIIGIEIDGNRSNQTAPTTTTNHWGGIDVASDCTRVSISDFYIHDTVYYGIGYQRNGFIDCHVDNGIIEDVGADGIDCKDDDGTSKGNTITRLTVRRFGLASATVDPNQCGINPRPGWTVDNVSVTEFDGDKHGIRFDSGGGTVNDQTQILSNFYINPGTVGTTVGLYINSTDSMDECHASNGRIVGCATGLSSASSYNQIENVRAKNCTTGFAVLQHTQLNNCYARSCTTGLSVTGPSNTISNFHAYSNTTGASISSGSSATTRIVGGVFSGNSTNISDSGTQTAIEQVSGVRTNSTGSATFDITTTGEKTVTVAHNLDFTPSLSDCIAWIERNTVVSDARYGGVLPYQVDGTNVYVKVYVTTASATGSATATCRVRAIVKKAPRQ